MIKKFGLPDKNVYVYCLGLVKKFKKFYIELTVSAIYHMKKEGFMLKYKFSVKS